MNTKILTQFKLLLRYINYFGGKAGTILFLKIQLKKTSEIHLPKIPYPFALRPETTDLMIFNQIFLKGYYDIKIPFTPITIIDGGAYTGLFSIYMKQKFPHSQIICIEPDLENFNTMSKNLSPYKGITFINGALWRSKINLKITDKFNIGKCAMVAEETNSKAGLTATGITMSDIINEHSLESIDILKLDIETAEKYLFSENFESWLPKVKVLIIELHDWLEPGCSKPFFTAINKIYDKYSYYILGDNTIIVNEGFEAQKFE